MAEVGKRFLQKRKLTKTLLQGLEEAHQRFGIECHAYCLMGNHYHLLLKTPQANLSRAMRHLNGVYTQRYNRRCQTDGPLFRGRYKAIVIDASSYFLQVSRYMHCNPTELNTPLVSQLDDYVWSSYPAYINRTQAPAWLYRDIVYAELGSQQKYTAYQNFVAQDTDEETLRFYQHPHTPVVLGDATFKAATDKKALVATEVARTAWQDPIPLATIIAQVVHHFGVTEAEIRHSKRGRGPRNLARAVAMKLGQERGGATLTELAQVFNVGHYSTISQTIARFNRHIRHDEEADTAYNMLSQDLTP